jgi:hypothetical protein
LQMRRHHNEMLERARQRRAARRAEKDQER